MVLQNLKLFALVVVAAEVVVAAVSVVVKGVLVRAYYVLKEQFPESLKIQQTKKEYNSTFEILSTSCGLANIL